MLNSLIHAALVKLLLFLAIQMVSLFNQMDDGDLDYEVVPKERQSPDVPF